MNNKVDVLAVMRRMHLQANACRSGGAGSGTQDFEDESAITAVAELIDSQRELLALVEQWAVQIEGEWGMCRDLDELEKDSELRPEIIRARAALANIVPQS